VEILDGYSPVYDEEPLIILEGGSGEDIFEEGDSQLSFDLGFEDEISIQNEYMIKMVVLQTENGVFLKFSMGEIPEKKKGAVGVRGIRLNGEDTIKKVYVIDAGDNVEVDFKGRKVETEKTKNNEKGYERHKNQTITGGRL
jgi:DNA gyrase/topoisomerase IV subunit A